MLTNQLPVLTDDSPEIDQLHNLVASIDPVQNASGQILASWLNLCPRHLYDVLNKRARPVLGPDKTSDKIISMASALRWMRAIASTSYPCIRFIDHSVTAQDQSLGITAIVDMVISISFNKHPVMIHGMTEEVFDKMIESETIKQRHVVEMNAILNMLDMDSGIIIHDTTKRFKMFMVRKDKAVMDAITRKCVAVQNSLMSGTPPSKCSCVYCHETKQGDTLNVRNNTTNTS